MLPRHNIGQLLQERGQFQEAARYYEEAEAIEPDPARFHANCGSLSTERGDYNEAARHYRLALAVDAASAEAHHGLGMALLEAGRLDAAEVAFREAIRIKPTQAVSWLALGGSSPAWRLRSVLPFGAHCVGPPNPISRTPIVCSRVSSEAGCPTPSLE